MKCKAKREIKNPILVILKNDKPATKGICPTCGTQVFRIGETQQSMMPTTGTATGHPQPPLSVPSQGQLPVSPQVYLRLDDLFIYALDKEHLRHAVIKLERKDKAAGLRKVLVRDGPVSIECLGSMGRRVYLFDYTADVGKALTSLSGADIEVMGEIPRLALRVIGNSQADRLARYDYHFVLERVYHWTLLNRTVTGLEHDIAGIVRSNDSDLLVLKFDAHLTNRTTREFLCAIENKKSDEI